MSVTGMVTEGEEPGGDAGVKKTYFWSAEMLRVPSFFLYETVAVGEEGIVVS